MAGPSGSSTWKRQQKFIGQTLNNRLDTHPAWPRQIFRLELETIGIYQDRSNKILNQLREDGKIGKTSIRLGDNDIAFITRPEEPSPVPEDEIKDATEELNDFFRDSSDFSELAAYTALCKVFDEIGENITGMQVLPSSHYPHILSGFQSQVDGLLTLRDEQAPIEVYNGSDFLSPKKDGYDSKKYNQIRERSREEQPVSNPILISRRTDGNFKTKARKEFDALVIDTDLIVGCKDNHPEIERISKLFNLEDIIQLLPPLETNSGIKLDGEKYINSSTRTHEAGTIRPPSEMVNAASTLPDQYLERIRGGVQLHYVNSFYRTVSERTKQDASLVVQQIYNLLLRDGGMSRRVALDRGWDEVVDSYRNLKSLKQRKDAILDETEAYITQLREERIITEQNQKIYARNSSHPQPTFSF